MLELRLIIRWGLPVSLSSSTAFLLVSHGSRDTRHGVAMARIGSLVRAQLQPSSEDLELRPASPPSLSIQLSNPSLDFAAPPLSQKTGPSLLTSEINRPTPNHNWSSPGEPSPPLVGTACLESGPLPLHHQIIGFGQRVKALGMQTIRIVPVFLLPGVHVMEDIPTEVAAAQSALPGINLEICSYLGSHAGLRSLVQTRVQETRADAWIMLAHGSRRSGGNRVVETLAQGLGGTTAYWSVPPSLENTAIHLMQSGVQKLTILPYFLFAGGLTDAIIHTTEELAERFPNIRFRLLPPLGPTSDLATLVTDLALHRPVVAAPTSVPLAGLGWRHPFRTSVAS